jgi:type II secretory ATPase GspE/PulE/Tfp pilus assembly ATPase PilB-like protein/RNA polymerase subunit RPABC4/transcription elongation factor Spt4
MRASDIHVEPMETRLRTRYRIDGLLRTIIELPKPIQNSVLSRLKLISGMDISERRRPQDGRTAVKLGGRNIDLRVSSLPTFYGEKIVMRILDKSKVMIDLEKLGFLSEDLQVFQSFLMNSQGMLIITGPTGSGKTSTLYAALSKMHNETENIITVEDPVEFQIGGINQVQINDKAGLTFSASLRSILRQDPNIVMLGEIRDYETAEIAFQAAMTGHYVLSTLHTNDAPSTINRIINIGVPPYIVASTLLGVVAQRLVRKICPQCNEEYTPQESTLNFIRLATDRPLPEKYWRGRGCESCDFTGFRGRLGVYEILEITDKIKELIFTGASSVQIAREASTAGMKTLMDDGIEKVRLGMTTLEEVMRVVTVERRGKKACPLCNHFLEDDFLICPYCTDESTHLCFYCGKPLKPEWRICPFCQKRTVEPHKAQALDQVVPGAVQQAAVPVRAAVAQTAVVPAAVAPAPPPPEPEHEETLSKPKILVVDDDLNLAELLKRFLEREFYDVTVAHNGREAIEQVYLNKPDLIITDVVMPEMDGIELCRKLKSQLMTSFIPIIMLTRQSDLETEVEGFEVGADDFLPKPVEFPKLIARVGMVLRRAKS